MPATIRKGDRGDDVVLCQQRLTEHGYPTSADGIFGSGTENVVMQFQRAQDLGADGIVGNNTWTALLAEPEEHELEPPQPLPPVLAHLASLGHEIMWEGDYHLNLFGIRNPSSQAGSFDDTLGCAYTENGMWKVYFWPGTTDPGTYYLEDQEKWYGPDGVAILAAGQYQDVWKIDIHGSYEALCQRNGAVNLYTDGNLDDQLDMDPETLHSSTHSGINLHAATSDPYNVDIDKTEIGAWSAGCQVHARTDGFREMMELARKQVEKLGRDTFTYTLMKQW